MSEDTKKDDEQKRKSGTGPMEMGMGMAKKMMGQMDGEGSGPMKKGMGMAKKMMGSKSGNEVEEKTGDSEGNPMMKMCKKMLGTIKKTSDMAVFATPELHGLFAEWLEVLENDAVEKISIGDNVTIKGLADTLNISEESVTFLISRLIKSGKIDVTMTVNKSSASASAKKSSK